MMPRQCLIVGAMVLTVSAVVWAQEAPIAYVPTAGVTVSGALEVANGQASVGNNGTITAGAQAVDVTLARGGELKVCGTTKVSLSRDTTIAAADAGLMLALDRGAVESSYKPGKYSDVLLTPDLRILISGPGAADLKIRVDEKGDTCVDNHGADAPYVTVTSPFEGGVYRVQANQRVMFEGGSLTKVVDNEAEPCGCPAETQVASGDALKKSAAATKSETANPFPLAQSEGLTPPEAPATQPVVPVGQVHAEVQAPIAYDAAKTPNPEAPSAAGKAPMQENPTLRANTPRRMGHPDFTKAKKQGGLFHKIGHFFAKMFGK